VRNELVFKRNTSCNSSLWRWRKAHFIPNRPIQLFWRKRGISPKKTICVEAGVSSTLFCCENWVHFWKEYFLPISVFKVEKCSFCSNYTYLAELKKHMYLSKEDHLCHKPEHFTHGFCVWIELDFKGILSAHQCFQGGETLILFKLGCSTKLKKHMHLSKQNIYFRRWSV
jgi:hypothetical protein